MSAKLTLVPSLLLLILLNGIHGGLALFEGCDNTFTVNPGISYLESPYYPSDYPTGTSCRYQFIAPTDYYIQVNCTVDLPINDSNCDTEYLYVSTEGDPQLRDSELFCGVGTFVRDSLFRRVAIAYVSKGSTGNFRCTLTTQPQSCDCGWSITTKIANGEAAGQNEFPFMAALKDTTSSSAAFCGATIISHRFLLTATHCTIVQPNANYIRALVGFNQLSTASSSQYYASYAIQSIIQYPGYTDNPPVNDISLLQTATNIEWWRGVGPICLPPSSLTNFVYNYVDVAGWGTQSFAGPTSDALMKANLMVISNSVCQESYDVAIYSSQICTNDYAGAGRDACQFDSGGPVILRGSRLFLVGCISYGQACGQTYGTGVNTRITYYLNWIRQQTGYTTCVKQLG
ncbi:PREDICTED: venom serine protease [Rhagoletis zephyria]|uniref:venom serine protease n=1 Tax=Rhagoletis zephyria TaxID=28612 RepID=UPI00081190BE|nr:PREDICTED: venom serine protease [Rhagoletis zephyria]XP_017477102.1 PREDICTED: venom serine protease [Rhagoletis zephyria]